MNRQKGTQYNKAHAKNWDEKRSTNNTKEDFFEYFNPAIEVRNGDVNKALRILKKRLERDDFLKDIARTQYYEKPSVKRKRIKDQAVKRQKKHERDSEAAGEYRPYMPTGLKHLKSKRKTRKIRDHHDRVRSQRQGSRTGNN